MSQNPQRSQEPNDRIIRRPELKKVAGISPSSAYRLEIDGKFPKRIKLSQGCKGHTGAVGWLYSEILEWAKNRERA